MAGVVDPAVLVDKEFEKLTRRRAVAKDWTTKAKLHAVQLLQAKEKSKVALSLALKEIEKRLKALEKVQTEYELELEEDQFVGEIDSMNAYLQDVLVIKTKLVELLEKFENFYSDSEIGSTSSRYGSARVNAKLPKLDLPTFSGEMLEWSSFWDQFTAIIHNSNLPAVTKFLYLKSRLSGVAADTIAGLSLTHNNYVVACDLLRERFGRPELMKFIHVQELLHLKPLGKQASVSELRSLYNKLLSHIRSLENLGVGGKEYGVFLTPLILSCLPADVRLEWARKSTRKESDLDFLVTFLTQEIADRERCQAFKGFAKPEVKESKSVKNESRPQSASTLPKQVSKRRNNSIRCQVCFKGHQTSKCWSLVKVSLEKRLEVCKKHGLCFRCLCKGHLAANCAAVCGGCQGKHHSLLCRKAYKSSCVSKDSKKGSGKVERPVSTIALPSKNRVDESLFQTEVSKVCGDKGSVKTHFPIVKGPVETHFPIDAGFDGSRESELFVKRWEPSFRRFDSFSGELFGTGIASKFKRSNFYNLELLGFV